jgi:hypothetical protein
VAGCVDLIKVIKRLQGRLDSVDGRREHFPQPIPIQLGEIRKKLRSQCLMLQFGSVRVGAVVYVCLGGSAVGQWG